MKKIIFSFIIGGIVFGGLVYATSYSANDITYTKDEQEINVETALNELYDKTYCDLSPTYIIKHGEPWNTTVTLSGTVPAGNKFIVKNFNQRIFQGGNSDSSSYTSSRTISHTDNVVYYAENNTTVSFSVKTSSGRDKMTLLIVYWPSS